MPGGDDEVGRVAKNVGAHLVRPPHGDVDLESGAVGDHGSGTGADDDRMCPANPGVQLTKGASLCGAVGDHHVGADGAERADAHAGADRGARGHDRCRMDAPHGQMRVGIGAITGWPAA